MAGLPQVKPLEWLGNTRRAVSGFPKSVRQVIGQALYAAQLGDKHQDAKPLRGFGGASVVEVISDYDGDTFRAVYTVRFRGVVYTLHAFQKKAKTGIKTPRKELNIIKQRLREAQHDYRERYSND